MRRLLLAAGLVPVAVAAGGALAKGPAFTGGEPVESRRVIDGVSLALSDGRTLRLADIEAPSPPLGRRTTAALERAIAGKTLLLRYAGASSDREGRVVAELFAGGRWVQRELVRRGLARVRGTADERIGLVDLLAEEDAARRARRGLWRERRYAVREAEDAGRDGGTWQIVEGTVTEVVPGSEGTYLEFGPDRANAFAAHIPRAALALVRAAGFDPPSLKGVPLRVRGFIDGTRRPVMEVTFPEQMERP